ncbi:hypothetical protein [Nonomuraea sp. NPDC048826]|uniref:hypothetical protein n=1 Tax=Nonomuraea sp. NPDC048826 TaxID=3364347 RepID=UPI003716CEFC
MPKMPKKDGKGAYSTSTGRDADEDRRGEVEDDGRILGERVPAGGHLSGDTDWVDSDDDDPDAGSGRTDADDGGYLPGEGTGRPY